MAPRSRPALLARRTVAWLLAWVFAAALYLLLIDTTSLPELIVGAGAAVLAATGAELAREQGIVGESVRWRWFARLYRPLARAPRDILIVSREALRALGGATPRGRFIAVPFRCPDQAPRAAGRQGLAEAAGSFAPATFVIGVDEEREVVLAHQLGHRGGRETIDPLELG